MSLGYTDSFAKIGWGCVDWIDIAQDMDEIINFRVP
jgi:hypothetical protein